MKTLKTAFRSLRSTPSATLLVVATLALAIGANAAIFSLVDGVLLRPLGYGDEEKLVVLWGTHHQGTAKPQVGTAKPQVGTAKPQVGTAKPQANVDLFRLSPADYRDVRDSVAAFEGQVALYRSIGSTLTGIETQERVGTMAVTPRLFSLLGATPAVGSFFNVEDETRSGPRRVVLTYDSWQTRFAGDPFVVGSKVELDGAPYLVAGVASREFQFPPGASDIEMYFPMILSDGILLDRDHRMFDAVARMADDTNMPAAQQELDAMAARLAEEFPTTNEGWGLQARSLRSEVIGDLGATLRLLAGAVFLVLLVGCANISNVMLARSTRNSQEFAIRAALGAPRSHLLGRSLAESVLLGLLGWSLGVVLAIFGVALLRRVLPQDIPRVESISVDASVLWFALVLALFATTLVSLVPAYKSMAPNVTRFLGSGRGSKSDRVARRLRQSLVMVEVALAVVLFVGACLMVKSFQQLERIDPGFHEEGVVSIAIKAPVERMSRNEWGFLFESLVETASGIPNVTAAGAVSDLPMTSLGLDFELEFTLPTLDTVAPSVRPNADFRLVVPGYFEAMGMSLAAGRTFERLEPGRRRNICVVNGALVERYFQGVDPIGRILKPESLPELTIVGVVGDVHHNGLMSKHESEVYLPFGDPIATAEMHVVAHSDGDVELLAANLATAFAQRHPEVAPASPLYLSEALWESLAQPRFNTALLASLALCSLLLAMIGIYGIVAFTVSQRRAEIGIRIALGSNARSTVALVMGQALAVVMLGSLVGLGIALLASRFASRLFHDTAILDPRIYAFVLAVTTLVGVLASLRPALRASRIDPVAALRDSL